MIRPTLEEVAEYIAEKGLSVDPEHWFDYYLSNGFKIGKNPMKDWQACVRNWHRKNTPSTPRPARNQATFQFLLQQIRSNQN